MIVVPKNSPGMTPADIRYVARVHGVKELSLVGRVDADYWQSRLRPWGLAPRIESGAARLMVVAASLRWKGAAFREVSFSLLLEPVPGAPLKDAAVLLHAFNTNRFFAFSERFFFSTPYQHARVDLHHTAPRGLRVENPGGTIFAATVGEEPRPAPAESHGGQFGPVFLPPRGDGPSTRYFVADIHGPTRAWAFEASRDTVEIGRPQSDLPLITQLRDSGFHGEQWIVRPDAFHGKSGTCKVRPGGMTGSVA